MNKELLKLKKDCRENLPIEIEQISQLILNIFTIKYSINENDFHRKCSTCVNLSTHFNDKQCVNECPLSDKQLLPLFNEGAGIARVIYKVLLEISDETPSVTYAPLLFPVISFMCLYLTESEIKNTASILLGDVSTIPSSTNDWNVFCHLLPVLGRRYATKACRSHSGSRQQLYFWPYAIWSLPLPFLCRVVVCFFIEGIKVLLRAGLLLWKEAHRRRGTLAKASLDMREALTATAATINRTYTPQSFLDRMFRIRNFSRASIERGKRAVVMSSASSGGWISPTASKSYVAFKTKHANPSAILSHSELIDIIRHLNPFLAQLNRPVPLFASEKHGHSLRTLYNVAGETPATLLIVHTALGEVIGAFCADPWSLKNRPDANRFYGKGECFVFKLRPKPMAFYRWNQNRDNALSNMFQRATIGALEVGGGSSGTAIHIDSYIARGTSACSTTFNSPCLTEFSRGDFLIKSLELLAFEEIR